MPLNKNAFASLIHAVIDIGSNSVRLVIYRVVNGAFFPIHNEKVLAGLGENVSETGKLSADGAILALGAIKRFKILLDAWRIRSYDAIATAAVRYASDGNQFIDAIRRNTGLHVRIISGEDEGRLSALGVLYGSVHAHGFMGDLGGSSLELAALDKDQNLPKESWPLGPLAMGELSAAKILSKTHDATLEIINKYLRQSKVLQSANTKEFHLVGGAWRTLAIVHMTIRNYPIHILQNYSISGQDALEITTFLASQSRKSIEKIPGISARRAETLPYASLLLKSIIECAGVEQLIFSAYGLREGVLFERFSAKSSFANPLMASALAVGAKTKMEKEFSVAMNIWLQNIVNFATENLGLELDEELLLAACYLANIGKDLHPDHRARLAYDLVLQGPYPSASHEERLYLARIIAIRYGAKADELAQYPHSNMLDENRIFHANLIGSAMRLASAICAGEGSLLAKTKLSIEGECIRLSIVANLKPLYSPTVEKRLKTLAEILGKQVEVQ
ncbi:MAG: exopolyphosphatase / guanosine-5'-triphosphate 3'-diphosphate pyrophosphatase [Hyphomonadaceae bacterium]|nr:MAG: exopolyphosphatase / guanosine-5'-triphosphate 3'-diphosphate pyrophosphatase [Hyphomonadaceae bacterium]